MGCSGGLEEPGVGKRVLVCDKKVVGHGKKKRSNHEEREIVQVDKET